MTRGILPALFLVSAATVGYEIALTRYFAVAKWSEYGYWVISIVLAGFALSGVVMALARDAFAGRGVAVMAWLPAVLIAAAAAGYYVTTTNPFNPLQLQNATTFGDQLWFIAGYYAGLLPFFFLAGVFVSLSFVLNERAIGRVYGFDLTGAGAGSLLVLALMTVVHPFALVPCLLVLLALAAIPVTRGRRAALAAAIAVLAVSEVGLWAGNAAAYNDFKAIYAPLSTPGAKVLAILRSPRGLYTLLQDFTEHVDTDVSNNAAMLGYGGPPESLGLYRDGNRLAALPKPGAASDTSYAGGTLAALPYTLIPRPAVLLAGTSGGFRIAEALRLGAASVDALEPEPVVRRALEHGLGPVPPLGGDARVHLSAAGPVAAAGARSHTYDLIDLSADFLDAGEANTAAFAAEAVATYMHALKPGGILSIPVSIRDFPAYALRMLATVRAGLLGAGIADPAAHVLAYRSAWNVRILVSATPFDAARIAAAKKFCDERSFDITFYNGMDVAAARAGIYNDLPPVSFDSGEVDTSGGAHDAIADEAAAVLAGATAASGRAFNLAPITYDRPAFYALLRLENVGTILKRLELLPQAEIGPLVNLAVLAQAVVIALIVLAVPLVAGGRLRAGGAGVVRPVVYFAALGLGFLFLEIFLIDRASFYLNDRASGFALVLTGMLIFSGLGSMTAERFAADPRRGMALAVLLVVVWALAMLAGLQPFLLATLTLPWPARAGIVLLLVAPLSIALGLPFPLGLSRAGSGPLLPWAWGLNGAFSVVATPLANLVAITRGYQAVLLAATVLYVTAVIAFPILRKRVQWQDISAT
ncbi:MAG TPA: hypothetical protein VHS58_07675 [Acetobacteraceae bacterium]|nr:hypothetical protein [Acetobacteraceae bacterium]